MRLRNVKNKIQILNACPYIISSPTDYRGKWNEVFKNNSPIEIEIGMGKGTFIVQKALNNRQINYIGIEKQDSILAKAVEKIPQDLPNLKIIMLDANRIEEVFSSEVDKLYLNFSDPWPKKRHAQRRLTSKVFLSKYDNIFKNSKVICQKTDNRNLFEFSLVNYSANNYIVKEISLDLHNSDITDNIMTEYERKFSEKGNVIYYVLVENSQFT